MQSPMVGQYSDKVKISGSTPDAKVPHALETHNLLLISRRLYLTSEQMFIKK